MKLFGAVVLALTGFLGGKLAGDAKQTQWRQVQRFCLLLDYLWQSVRYRGAPAQEILEFAALRAEFSDFELAGCSSFSQIRPPIALAKELGTELKDGLRELEYAPRESACRTLQYLLSLCRQIERQAAVEAQRAQRLYPRLGGCLGLLAAILLV